jgi:hypothetical protein
MGNAIQDPMDRLSNIIEGEKSPFVELSERMKETSKDVRNLNLSILDLAIALEERAGVSKDKKDKPKVKQDNDAPIRGLGEDIKADFEDFKKGLIHGFTGAFTEFKDNISAKSEMPATVEKPEPEKNTEDQNEPADDLQRKTEETDKITENNKENNKILSDMVAVLIDMRDDRSQAQLLKEAIDIKKILSDQNKKTELPGGIEPNTEEVKQEDREKLAEAIARKLGEVMEEIGIGSSSGLGIPNISTGGNKTKAKTLGKGGKLKSMAPMGGKLLGGAGLVLGAYEASEYLKETDYGNTMKQGAGQSAEKAFKENVAPTIDPIKAEVSKDQALAALENGSNRDIEKLGGANSLREIAGLPPLETPETPKPVVEQASLRKYDYIPDTSPKVTPAVTPKKEDNTVGTILNKVSDQNTELKMFNMTQPETQMLAPIVSQQTINNTEQTMLASTPTPHSTANAFNKWQMKRSTYTD